MNPKTLVGSVRDGVTEARNKVEMVAAHGQDVVKTGVQTLQAARGVVAEGGREAVQVLSRTRDELKKTLADGAAQVGDKLKLIATPTRREQAAARKAEVKQKKRASNA